MIDLTRFNVNENGNVIEYNVLSTFNLEGREDSYIIYTDYSINEHKKMNIKYSRYRLNDDRLEILPIETDDENQEIQPILEEIEKMISK